LTEELTALLGPDLFAFEQSVSLVGTYRTTLLELCRHRVGLRSKGPARFSFTLVTAQADRAGSDDQDSNQGGSNPREPFKPVDHHQWNICTVVG
jgi:hypothetical protein